MKKTAVLVAALAVLAAGGWALKRKLARPARPDFTSVAVKQGPIEETVEATGAVAPYHRVEIKAAISGRIEKLLVNEGDRVKAGQIIAWMSSTDRAAILDAALAQGPEVYKKWQDTYKATPIIAPLPGYIILNNVVEGQTVDPSLVIYAMADVLIVVAQVDESDIGRVHLGMPARVTLDSYPDKAELGKVFDMLYEGRNVSNVIQYPVKVRFPDVPSYYRSQMTANISFITREKKDAVLVPAAAVKEARSGAKTVLVPGPDGQPSPVEVKTGIETDDAVEILDGVKPGDTVLLAGAKYVPQKGPESSPLTFGGMKRPQSGAAPKPKKG